MQINNNLNKKLLKYLTCTALDLIYSFRWPDISDQNATLLNIQKLKYVCICIYNRRYTVCVFVFTPFTVASEMIRFLPLSSGLSYCDIIIHRNQRSLGQTWVGWTIGQHLQAESFQDFFFFLCDSLSYLAFSYLILSCFISFFNL